MRVQIAGKAALIAMVAICVTAAQASATSHHKARRAASAAQTMRVASASPGYLVPASYLVPANSVPVILGIGF